MFKAYIEFYVISNLCWRNECVRNELSAVEQKAASCFVCHGDKGKSNNSQVPSLAGQQSVYVVTQLNAYQSGERKNPVMQKQVQNLTPEDINNYGAYFAVQKPEKKPVDKALLPTNRQDKASVCLGCHGEAGEGNGQFPRLAGQQGDYLLKQLIDFKKGVRSSKSMQAITGSLPEEELKTLAIFFSAL